MRSALPTDPALPAMADLLDAEAAAAVVAAALDGAGDVESVRPTQVRHERGRRIVVRYAVEGRWVAGWPRVQTVVAEHGRTPPPPGTALVGDGTVQVAVWRYPFDPHLPGLAAAAHPGPARAVLADLGIEAGPVEVRPRAYRASRRAVLQVRSTGPGAADLCYLKVVRPHTLGRLVAAHAAVAAAAPAPAVLGTADRDGVAVLEVRHGEPLRTRLLGSGAAPDPVALVDLQRRLADADPAGLPPARRADVDRHAGVLAGLLPDREPTIRRIAEVARSAAGGPEGVVHGDLYEGQVLVDQRGALSLIDLDGAGTGPVLDDCATVVAHLWALAQWRPAAATRITRWADAYVAAATGIVDPHALRHRAAGVLLGLAAGGFAVGETTWHDTAVERLAAAARLAGIADEEVLMATSPRSHARPAR